jgi:uncharacterized protein (UPF0261 family)
MSVVIIATLDTKGEEAAYARDAVAEAGLDTHVVDAGVLGEPSIPADTPRAEVATRGGADLEALREAGDRGEAVDAMADGAAQVVAERYEAGDCEGVLALGGSAGTTIGTRAMRALPYGVPKVMLSTMASGDVRPYVGPTDVTMAHSVADIAGLNRLTRQVIGNAASAVAGMVAADAPAPDVSKPTVAVTMFGVTTSCVEAAREYLEERGYEVLVFHATGTGGQAMEDLIEQGIVDAVLDVTTTELADELVGGVLSAGPGRLEAAGERGIPQVVSVGALDMVNFGPEEEVPERFRDRTLHVHNATVTLMRTTPEENRTLGRLLAGKVNEATGPVTVALPLGGVSALDVAGEDFHDSEADRALFDAIRETLDSEVDLLEMEADVNAPEFARAMAERLDTLYRKEADEDESGSESEDGNREETESE